MIIAAVAILLAGAAALAIWAGGSRVASWVRATRAMLTWLSEAPPALGCELIRLGETNYCFEPGDGITVHKLYRDENREGGKYRNSSAYTAAMLSFHSKLVESESPHAEDRALGFLVSWALPIERKDRDGKPHVVPWTLRPPTADATTPEHILAALVISARGEERRDEAMREWRRLEQEIASKRDGMLEATDFISISYVNDNFYVWIDRGRVVKFARKYESAGKYNFGVHMDIQYPDDEFEFRLHFLGKSADVHASLANWSEVADECRDALLGAKRRAFELVPSTE